MSCGMMWKMMWFKARYGVKSYLFFLFATILFVALFFLQLALSNTYDLYDNQSNFMIGFLYIPVLINQAMQTMEYSKCHYLVPKTASERKKFFVFQNIVKMIMGLVGTTVLYFLGCWINPAAKSYLINWYLTSGISSVLVAGVGGFTNFYVTRKKRSYGMYIANYSITVIVMLVILFVSMFFIENKYYMYVKYGVVFISFVYALYHSVRFIKVSATYENINKEEHKFTSRVGNCIT